MAECDWMDSTARGRTSKKNGICHDMTSHYRETCSSRIQSCLQNCRPLETATSAFGEASWPMWKVNIVRYCCSKSVIIWIICPWLLNPRGCQNPYLEPFWECLEICLNTRFHTNHRWIRSEWHGMKWNELKPWSSAFCATKKILLVDLHPLKEPAPIIMANSHPLSTRKSGFAWKSASSKIQWFGHLQNLKFPPQTVMVLGVFISF